MVQRSRKIGGGGGYGFGGEKEGVLDVKLRSIVYMKTVN